MKHDILLVDLSKSQVLHFLIGRLYNELGNIDRMEETKCDLLDIPFDSLLVPSNQFHSTLENRTA